MATASHQRLFVQEGIVQKYEDDVLCRSKHLKRWKERRIAVLPGE